jgi:hypothetical protein
MNQKQWATCSDPGKMLKSLRGKASERKLRLFACACVRRGWALLTPASRAALEINERYADGGVGRRELTAARRAATVEGDRMYAAAEATTNPEQGQFDPDVDEAVRANAAEAARLSLTPRMDVESVRQVTKAMDYTVILWHAGPGGDPDEAHCDLLRELFGNPFRALAVERSWLTWNDGTIPKLAGAICEARTFQELPVLADALEDASCDDAEILNHLRGPGPHVRGCWALDLLLSKQ